MNLSNLLFIDTETCSLNKREVIQLAYKGIVDGVTVAHDSMYRPSGKIDLEAMCAHGITDWMVEEKLLLSEHPEELNDLKDQLNKSVFVAHNAKFDIDVLKKYDVNPKWYFDTLQIARHVLDLPKYNLQYLRYYFDIRIEGQAHSAWGDICVLEKVFIKLAEEAITKYNLPDEQSLYNKLFELTDLPVLIKTFKFGKYKDHNISDILKIDRGYLEWLNREELKKLDKDRNNDMLYTLNHYLA